MKTFTDYKSALTHATELATSCNRDAGLAKAREFGKPVFNVFLLPNPENRRGHELTCEVVRPGDPAPAPATAGPAGGEAGTPAVEEAAESPFGYAIKTPAKGYLATQGREHWFQDTPTGWALFSTREGAASIMEAHHSAIGTAPHEGAEVVAV